MEIRMRSLGTTQKDVNALFDELIATYKDGLNSTDFDSMAKVVITKASERIRGVQEKVADYVAQLAQQRSTCNEKATKAIGKFDSMIKTMETTRNEFQNRFDLFAQKWSDMFAVIIRFAPKEVTTNLISEGADFYAKHITAMVYDGIRLIEKTAESQSHQLYSAQVRCYEAIFGNVNNDSSEEEFRGRM